MSEQLSLIDWEQLDMIADGYTEDFVEIYREFMAELPLVVEDISQAIVTGDATQISRKAHQLKGAAANFGFLEVSSLAAKLEMDAKSGNITDAASQLSALQTALESSIAIVAAEKGMK